VGNCLTATGLSRNWSKFSRYPLYTDSVPRPRPPAAPPLYWPLRMPTATTIETHSPEETIAYGRSLAAELTPPLIILLHGDLGAGKTTLVKGIAEGFQAARAEDVTSPTFTLIHEYRSPRATLYHIDLYRIDTERELETLALDDLLAPTSILLIEWGEKFPRLQRDQNMEISLERMGETERRIQRTTR
jgi:tRNA threonylcarbamoyladenosine biosynthesis protein TsaE